MIKKTQSNGLGIKIYGKPELTSEFYSKQNTDDSASAWITKHITSNRNYTQKRRMTMTPRFSEAKLS